MFFLIPAAVSLLSGLASSAPVVAGFAAGTGAAGATAASVTAATEAFVAGAGAAATVHKMHKKG